MFFRYYVKIKINISNSKKKKKKIKSNQLKKKNLFFNIYKTIFFQILFKTNYFYFI